MKSIKSGVLLSSGYFMPQIGLGTWQTENEEEIAQAIKTAIDCGYRLIDTAYVYDNEAFIGKTLKSIFESGKISRSDLFITSKLPEIGMKEEDVEYFCQKSLSALQLDYIDLYLIHSPTAAKKINDDDNSPYVDGRFNGDHDIDISETWKAMEALVDKALVRSIGLSNFNSKQVQRIADNARIKPSNLQVECHAYLPQYELQAFCKKLNISFTAYGPLGSPNLLSYIETKFKYKLNEQFPSLLDDCDVKSLAEKYEKTPAQILLRNLIQRDIIVIPKSSNPKRIKENIDLFDFDISSEDMDKLKSIAKGFRYFKNNMPGKIDHPEYPYNEPF